MRTALALLALSLTLFACAGVALAQEAHDAEARSLFQAGRAAFADGRFEDALARFREAYELSGRPELLYNVASSLDRLGHLEEAAEQYERYLQERPNAPNRNYVERRLELIAEQTDGTATGTKAEPAEPQEPEDTEAATEGPAEGGGEPAGEPAPVSPPPSPEDSGPSRVAPITLFGVAGGAAIGALVTGLMASAKYADLEDTCPEGRCPEDARSDRDSLRTLGITTDVLIGVAAASAVVGVVLWMVGGDETPEQEPRVRAGMGCSGEGCGVGAAVAF